MARIPVDDARFRAARELGEHQGWVLSRKQLYAIGITRWEIRGQVRMLRWQLIGDQSVCLHNGPIEDWGHHWAAVFQGGPRALLDGASSLVAGGLERFTVERIRVSVPRGARIRRNRRYNIRQTRRWDADDRAPSGIPRTRPDVAAVRGFLWASTDREATYLITLTVQQGLAPPDALGREALRVLRDKRRGLLHAVLNVLNDLLDGARSLGELDVARELRRRGLPPPARQVLRRDRANRYYLDLYWPEFGLVVESTASTTRGRRTSSATRSARTPSPSTATRCCGCRCWDCASTPTSSSARSRRRSRSVVGGRLHDRGARKAARDVMRAEHPLAPSA